MVRWGIVEMVWRRKREGWERGYERMRVVAKRWVQQRRLVIEMERFESEGRCHACRNIVLYCMERVAGVRCRSHSEGVLHRG